MREHERLARRRQRALQLGDAGARGVDADAEAHRPPLERQLVGEQ